MRTEIGDLEQADGRGNDDRGQRGGGQMPEQVRRRQQQQRDGDGADDAGQLGSRARGLRHRRARRTAADRKALKEPGGQIGGAEPDHLLVGIDLGRRSARRRRATARWCRRTRPARRRCRRSGPARYRHSRSTASRTPAGPAEADPSTDIGARGEVRTRRRLPSRRRRRSVCPARACCS